MTSRTQHTVTDSRGQIHTRTSLNRRYSHAIVTHFKARPADENWRERPAYSHCEWASRLDLAEKVASGSRHSSTVDGVEIIPATVA